MLRCWLLRTLSGVITDTSLIRYVPISQLNKNDDNLVIQGRKQLKAHEKLKEEFWKDRNRFLGKI